MLEWIPYSVPTVPVGLPVVRVVEELPFAVHSKFIVPEGISVLRDGLAPLTMTRSKCYQKHMLRDTYQLVGNSVRSPITIQLRCSGDTDQCRSVRLRQYV